MSNTSSDDARYADDAHRYRLDSHLATGGMGEVWKGTDTVLNRVVAVKVLKPEFAGDNSFRTRFETEARSAAALHHPAVAAVFDFGEAAAKQSSGYPAPYLVMEYVDGQPLSDLIRPDAPMDPAAVRALLAQAADGLGVAHAAGIVHRDIKPANLMVTRDRHVKVTDFGIARAMEGMALTQTGQVMGTPQYLSPEQAQGQRSGPASDVYSLGVVAYECLAGRRPFQGETAVATALAHVRETPPPLPASVPADLTAVVMRALAKEPDRRFPDATAFAAALRDPAAAAQLPPPVATVGPVATAVPPRDPDATQTISALGAEPDYSQPTPAQLAPTPGQPERRKGNPAWVWVLFVVATLLIAGVAYALLSSTDDEPNEDPTTPTQETSQSSEPTTEPTTPPTSEPTTAPPTTTTPPTTEPATEPTTEPTTPTSEPTDTDVPPTEPTDLPTNQGRPDGETEGQPDGATEEPADAAGDLTIDSTEQEDPR